MGASRFVHELAAGRVYSPARATARRCRPSQRAAYLEYRAGLRFRLASQGWGHDQRRDWQLAELRRTVRHAYATTTFYRERLDSAGFDPREDFDFDSYAALPVLEREEVREAGRAMVSSAVDRSLLREDSTGGSTGTPTRLWTGPRERGWSESGSEYFMTRIGLPPGSRLAYLWGHHLDPSVRSGWRDRLMDHLDAVRWYDCFRLDDEVLGQYHRDLQSWQPRGMVAYASSLAALAEAVAARPDRPLYPRCGFVTGAEKLHAHQRAIVERVFGRPVHERYGSRDAGLMGFQLDPGSALDFTVDWARVMLEPDASPATNGGVAGVIVTKLQSDGMPMLRYRVGDLARFPDGARPGEPAFVLHEVLGRDMDRVWLRDGRWMHPAVVPHMMKDYPVYDFQLHQHADYSVKLRVRPAPGYSDATESELLGTLRTNLPGLPVSVSVETEIERTRANKWRPVSSDVPPPKTAVG